MTQFTTLWIIELPPPSPIQCCLYVARGLWHHDTTLFWGEGVNRLTQQGQLKQNMAVARTFHTLTRIHHRCESFWPHSQMLIQNANGVWVPICWASHSLRVWMLILPDWDRSPCPFRPSRSTMLTCIFLWNEILSSYWSQTGHDLWALLQILFLHWLLGNPPTTSANPLSHLLSQQSDKSSTHS